jgi:DNA-binding PadR family transcriptional regulator
MNLLDTLNPVFIPDLSKARRIVGKASAMPFKNALFTSQLPLTIRILEELVEGESTSPEMTTTLDANPKSVASTFSWLKKGGYVSFKWFRKPGRQRMAMYSINEKGRNHLEKFNETCERKTNVSNIPGNPRLDKLESLPDYKKPNLSVSLQQAD